ncbi:hypothetical protein GQ42DRAFT_70882 [Ramicandelaber brevisporus]|nr:hypothetical protein GQ42DRAFT_70882 [Ramicandelaber brevisporus]
MAADADLLAARRAQRRTAYLQRASTALPSPTWDSVGQLGRDDDNSGKAYIVFLNAGFGGSAGLADPDLLERHLRTTEGYIRLVVPFTFSCSFAEYDNVESGLAARERLEAIQREYIANKNVAGFISKGTGELIMDVMSEQAVADIMLQYEQSLEYVHVDASSAAGRIHGLFYEADFLSQHEADAIEDEIARANSSDVASNAGESNGEEKDSKWTSVQNRFVQHYMNAFDYHTKHIGRPDQTVSQQFPHSTRAPIARIEHEYRPMLPDDFAFDQLTVSRYPPGAGISPHVDSHTSFKDGIAIFSLGSSVDMELRRTSIGQDGKQNENEVVCITLEPRSMLLMTADLRYKWTHSIRSRKLDPVPGTHDVRVRQLRTSLTLRAINWDRTCDCQWPEMCDRSTPFGRFADETKE